jgi:hypothetical protein
MRLDDNVSLRALSLSGEVLEEGRVRVDCTGVIPCKKRRET